jgi:uncharacterized protein
MRDDPIDWAVAYAHGLTNAELAAILEYSSNYHFLVVCTPILARD